MMPATTTPRRRSSSSTGGTLSSQLSSHHLRQLPLPGASRIGGDRFGGWMLVDYRTSLSEV
jgi:hypothetical protein